MSVGVKCDTCGSQLDNSGPYPAYMITVHSGRVPNLSGSELGIYVTPEVALGRHDFCSKRCLLEFMK